MIVKVPQGFRVLSRRGRNMGTYRTLQEAQKRLRQVEMFGAMKKR